MVIGVCAVVPDMSCPKGVTAFKPREVSAASQTAEDARHDQGKALQVANMRQISNKPDSRPA